MFEVTAVANGYYGSKIRVPLERFGITDVEHLLTITVSPCHHWWSAEEQSERIVRPIHTGMYSPSCFGQESRL